MSCTNRNPRVPSISFGMTLEQASLPLTNGSQGTASGSVHGRHRVFRPWTVNRQQTPPPHGGCGRGASCDSRVRYRGRSARADSRSRGGGFGHQLVAQGRGTFGQRLHQPHLIRLLVRRFALTYVLLPYGAAGRLAVAGAIDVLP